MSYQKYNWPSLADQLKSFSPDNNEETAVKSKFLELLEEGKIAFQRQNLNRHITGSAFLLNQDLSKVLLTHHKKLGKWLQLGGHCDGNESALHTAFLESQEESGISDISILKEDIFDLNIHFIPKHKEVKEHYHYDVRYLLKANVSEDNIIISDESIDLRWFSLDELQKDNMDEDVAALGRKLVRYKNRTLETSN